jgi:hypothetical protein
MIISSRTPEGDLSICPICGTMVCLEPSIDTADAPCPCCGLLLWFVKKVTPDFSPSQRQNAAQQRSVAWSRDDRSIVWGPGNPSWAYRCGYMVGKGIRRIRRLLAKVSLR